MKLNNYIVMSCAMMVVTAVAAVDTATSIVKMTPEERLEYDGGPYQLKGKGWVAAIDCRSNPDQNDYAEGSAKIEFELCTIVSNRIQSAFSISTASNVVKAYGANVAVFIIDDESMPMTLSAPEEKWSLVNVAKLKVSDYNLEKFRKRVSMMFTRQCCRALGSDEGPEGETCFKTVFNAEDVDKIDSMDITYSATTQIFATMPLRGMEPIDWGSYRDACQLGIAPMPINDNQRRVWDEVHAIPAKPLKIKYQKK